MKNITIICLSDYIRKETGKRLAKDLSMSYLDVDELLDYELIDKKQVSVKCGDEYLQQLERDLIVRVAEYEDCVYSISADMYMANDNRVYLDETNVVYLETEQHKIDVAHIKNKAEKVRLTQEMDIYHHVNQYLKETIPFVITRADNKSLEKISELIKENIKKQG